MQPQQRTIPLLIGSYSGQDSFGDKCLARCVAAQLQAHLPISGIRSHIHDLTRVAEDGIEQVEFLSGFSPLFWRWFTILRHLRLPLNLHTALALLSLPLYLAAQYRQMRHIRRSVREAPLLYFYGGTQLSSPWFRLNMLPLAVSILYCRLRGVPVYFGPQQYGPQSIGQLALMRIVLLLVHAARTRNPNCRDLLGLPDDALLFDEVFSCTRRYPLIAERSGAEQPYMLINVRGLTFVDDSSKPDFQAAAALIMALQTRLQMPIKLFQMSGASFSDDRLIAEYLAQQGMTDLEIVPALDDEATLIGLARGAYGMLSMSFHGCVFGMIGGCPAVPLSAGGYYDYKYVDYDRYSGNQGARVIFLQELDVPAAVEWICGYFADYDAIRTAETRRTAAEQMDAWYGSIAADLDHHPLL